MSYYSTLSNSLRLHLELQRDL